MYPCPHCQERRVWRHGHYRRPADGRRMARFRCQDCRKTFSAQHYALDFRLRKRRANQLIFRLLCRGLSQRACASVVGMWPPAIARRLDRWGALAALHCQSACAAREPVQNLVFDEMESFIHTKLKPVTIPLAVEEGTRKILGLAVGAIPAKGPLAELARKKYGPRPNEKGQALEKLMAGLAPCLSPTAQVKSDKSPAYPPLLARFFPEVRHRAFKGRRGCVVGQGELKRGGKDPLFSLNHTAAMIRDNVKRMARRTWCTSKRIDRLERHLWLYAYFHNAWVAGVRRVVLRGWKPYAPLHT